MTYLIGQIVACLVGAAFLGFLMGWSLHSYFSHVRSAAAEDRWGDKFRDSEAKVFEFERQLDTKNQEIRELRTRLESI